VTAGVFCLSAVFPIAAGLSKDTSAFPEWWGPADVGVAAVLAALSVAVIILGGKHIDDRAAQASYRVYRVLIHVILAMTSVYILAGDRIVWSQGLPGIAWRTWLLMYGLPAWLTLQSPPGILAGGSSESGSRP
jgi:hypothetical protein